MRVNVDSVVALLLVLVGVACTHLAEADSSPVETVPHPSADRLLDAYFNPQRVVDMALSPSGRYLAMAQRLSDDALLAVLDLETGERRNIVRIAADAYGRQTAVGIVAVYWKADDRILFRTRTLPTRGAWVEVFNERKVQQLGDRLFALDRDGENLVRLLEDTRGSGLDGAFDLGSISSFLPLDPDHVVTTVNGFRGLSLFRVNVRTGVGTQTEKPSLYTAGWWLDVDGNAVVRTDITGGWLNLLRTEENGRWTPFQRLRVKDLQDRPSITVIGPGDQPGDYYVLARPDGAARTGIYRFNIANGLFGQPVVEHPTFDLTDAAVSRDGKTVLYYCFVVHVLECRFSDTRIDEQLARVRGSMGPYTNIRVASSSLNFEAVLLLIDGPNQPPAWFRYKLGSSLLESLGTSQPDLHLLPTPHVSVVSWTARDGIKISGYLSRPSGAGTVKRLPLVVMPHGGPEDRDSLGFDATVQYLSARGYAVFQPNFRGSDGFGREFAELGYREWGGKMQDDVTDGVLGLIGSGAADPERICILGASYGGYAALMGAALTPSLYRCAVSIAGVTDLVEFIRWRRREYGKESDGYTYWLDSIGNPDVDAERLQATSPVNLAASITVPVLLAHGSQDDIVPIAQSRSMHRALGRAGRESTLIEYRGENHSAWHDDSERDLLAAIDAFLREHLGQGHGPTGALPAATRTPMDQVKQR